MSKNQMYLTGSLFTRELRNPDGSLIAFIYNDAMGNLTDCYYLRGNGKLARRVFSLDEESGEEYISVNKKKLIDLQDAACMGRLQKEQKKNFLTRLYETLLLLSS